ncbi:hypothetical protein [Gaoshiqia sp. Z1-71]|uniref:hypothetical protein n=1 Tax=Gaoshiqia hydrogeniformans TaxID=3290090 RepID=UPI003BF7D2EB
MKKLIFLVGIVALMAACGAQAGKETAKEAETEMDAVEEIVADSIVVDSTAVAVPDSIEAIVE